MSLSSLSRTVATSTRRARQLRAPLHFLLARLGLRNAELFQGTCFSESATGQDDAKASTLQAPINYERR